MTPATAAPELIVLGASWGGLQAVTEILSTMPADFPIPILLVQHRAADREDLLSGLLDRAGPLSGREVVDGAAFGGPGVLIAPSGHHVLVEHGRLRLSTEPEFNFSRPSIDVTLSSAAAALGPALVGVILTGDNEDGAAGLKAVRRAGGVAVVQDPTGAIRDTMPRAAIAAADPQIIAPLGEIAGILERLAAGEDPQARP